MRPPSGHQDNNEERRRALVRLRERYGSTNVDGVIEQLGFEGVHDPDPRELERRLGGIIGWH